MRLILVCGLPGTGKTTVAEKIADKTKSFVFNTDIIRKELFGKPKYTKKEKSLVYDLLFEMAEKFLKSAKNVVLDGTFYKKELRKRVKEMAKKTDSEFHVVEVRCDEEILKERMGKRTKQKTPSDADFEIYMKIKKEFEPVREKHFVVDTGKEWEKQIEGFLKTI
ncbi:MAG: nucleoside monophosphate kinase [Candidatus Aenigmarchaeota archaeon]